MRWGTVVLRCGMECFVLNTCHCVLLSAPSPPPQHSAPSPTMFVDAAGVLSYPMALSIYKRQWRKDSQQELNKVKRLR